MRARSRLLAAAALAAAVLAAAAIPVAPLFGASLDARSLTYLPARYGAGEEVVAQALLVPDAGEKLLPLDLKRGAGLSAQADEADPELRELRLAKTAAGWQLSLRFVPWSPGRASLPAMRVKGIALPALPYAAASALGPEDRDPSPPRRQRDPPGTALFLYGLAGLLLILTLGAAGAAAYLVPAARALVAKRRAAQAFRRFVTSLEYLEAEAGSADPAAFFSALSRAFRLYLDSRALPDARGLEVAPRATALTAAEVAALPESAFPAPGTRDRTEALFSLADRVRYGDASPGAEAARGAAIEARSIGEANEEALHARL